MCELLGEGQFHSYAHALRSGLDGGLASSFGELGQVGRAGAAEHLVRDPLNAGLLPRLLRTQKKTLFVSMAVPQVEGTINQGKIKILRATVVAGTPRKFQLAADGIDNYCYYMQTILRLVVPAQRERLPCRSTSTRNIPTMSRSRSFSWNSIRGTGSGVSGRLAPVLPDRGTMNFRTGRLTVLIGFVNIATDSSGCWRTARFFDGLSGAQPFTVSLPSPHSRRGFPRRYRPLPPPCVIRYCHCSS